MTNQLAIHCTSLISPNSSTVYNKLYDLWLPEFGGIFGVTFPRDLDCGVFRGVLLLVEDPYKNGELHVASRALLGEIEPATNCMYNGFL